jgi:oxygen-independent coproporphyrinogen III oxidase
MKLVNGFVDSLVKEIELFTDGRMMNVDSIYLGGGTPSILDFQQLQKLFKCLHSNLKITSDCEITAECNPEDITSAYNILSGYKEIGINRISIGIQSFIDDELAFLSRQHKSVHAIESVKTVSELYKNFSIDIIYDLPGQSLESIQKNIEKIAELNVPHVSAYTLITEKGTLLHKHLTDKGYSKDVSSNDKLYSFFNERIRNLGYEHYEISNYSKKGFESRHNLKYWTFSEYIGFGPSAHSFFNGKRWNNFAGIRKYTESLESGNLPQENVEVLSPVKMEEDYFICTLRSKGVDKIQFLNIFNKNFDESYCEIINRLVTLKLGKNNEKVFELTENGYALADEITLEFIKSIKN